VLIRAKHCHIANRNVFINAKLLSFVKVIILANIGEETNSDKKSSHYDEVLNVINTNQQIAYHDIKDALEKEISDSELDKTLKNLENDKKIISRSSGGIMTYYSLYDEPRISKIMIVEDDKNINKLMSISIGKGYDITQVYDGGEALGLIKKIHPNLIILDLMLPVIDGMQICERVKSDPELSSAIVILVSAMDPTSNRFKGIKNGADYYIKKPFDPLELRTLVTLFLKKKGKRFDPLIDLPDEERISAELERSLKQGEKYKIGTLSIENLGPYANRFGEHSAIILLRLISQLLQDLIKNKDLFVGFLNSDSFVIAGMEDDVNKAVEAAQKEFNAVLTFVVQDIGYRQIDLNLDNIFESNEIPKLALTYREAPKELIKERREKILIGKDQKSGDLGSYTYDELQKLFGREDLDVIITRDANGIKLRVGKVNNDKGEEK